MWHRSMAPGARRRKGSRCSSAEVHSPIRLDNPARRLEFGIDRLAGLFFRSLQCTILPGRYILTGGGKPSFPGQAGSTPLK